LFLLHTIVVVIVVLLKFIQLFGYSVFSVQVAK